MKTCFACNKEKPLSEYYTQRYPDGTLRPKGSCKECTLERKRLLALSNMNNGVKTYADYLAESQAHHTDKYFKRKEIV